MAKRDFPIFVLLDALLQMGSDRALATADSVTRARLGR